MQTTSPPITELAARLRLAITRTARRLRQEGGGGLTPSLGAALGTIDAHGPLSPSALATRERIQRPTATRLVAKLEEAGLVTRTADPADGRVSMIAATSAGHALLAAQRRRKDAVLADGLARLSDEERATLERAAELLERLLADGEGRA